MKLKRWLALSHLIVMLMPIVSGVLLYWIINSYNASTNFMDYISAINKFKTYETALGKQELFSGYSIKDQKFIIEGDEQFVEIELYNAVGQQIYASSSGSILSFSTMAMLYSDLYKIQTGTKAYTLKKPVFKEGVLTGFYKIAIARSDFVQGVNYRTILIVSFFVGIVILVFGVIMMLLNKKLNHPIQLLVDGMNKFADGDENIVDYKERDEVGELISHFNAMKKEIEEKRKIIEEEQKSKEYMISAISHDLKTPLTAIRAYAETMTNEENTNIQKIKAEAKVILSKSDYMKNMIDDLMMYNLMTTQYSMNFVDLEGSELFEMLFSGYGESCEKNQIKLTAEMNVQGRYNADVRQITRVVDNLMANALRYTSDGGHIWMGAFSLGVVLPDWLEVRVIDQIRQWKTHGLLILIQNEGESISENKQEKIFTPFYQSDDSRNKQKWNGVGLGLSIVQLVIEKHEGEVRVFSEGSNTTFACWLPIN